MSDDWRVYLSAVLFSVYLGWLGGTRRDEDRRAAQWALGIAFTAGLVTAVAGNSGTRLAATSLVVGPPVAMAFMAWLGRRRTADDGRRSPQREPR